MLECWELWLGTDYFLVHTLVHAMDTFPFSLQGVPSEKLLTVLSHVPHAEKFAKFWICQAKLLARNGPFDVLQLYREAVSAGAEVSGACQLCVPCLHTGGLP